MWKYGIIDICENIEMWYHTCNMAGAIERLDGILHARPYNQGEGLVMGWSNEKHARAFVASLPNPDLLGGRRELIIDVKFVDEKPVVVFKYLPTCEQ